MEIWLINVAAVAVDGGGKTRKHQVPCGDEINGEKFPEGKFEMTPNNVRGNHAYIL